MYSMLHPYNGSRCYRDEKKKYSPEVDTKNSKAQVNTAGHEEKRGYWNKTGNYIFCQSFNSLKNLQLNVAEMINFY